MAKSIFPIHAGGLIFPDRSAVFRYIVDTFRMYYDAVDVVRETSNDAMIISTTENEPYFNFCIHKEGDLSECIARNKPIFEEFKREPLFYISPASSYFGAEIPMKKFADDAYMFLQDESILQDYQPDDSIKVELCEDEELYLEIFAKARSGDGDIYGAPPDVLEGLRKIFNGSRPPAGVKAFALMAYKDKTPAGNVIGVYNQDFMLLNGLGIVPEFRGLGIAKALTKEVIGHAHKLGIHTMTLQTESSSVNEAIYKKMGFATKFNSAYYKA